MCFLDSGKDENKSFEDLESRLIWLDRWFFFLLADYLSFYVEYFYSSLFSLLFIPFYLSLNVLSYEAAVDQGANNSYHLL